jgi:hypothetical protein
VLFVAALLQPVCPEAEQMTPAGLSAHYKVTELPYQQQQLLS